MPSKRGFVLLTWALGLFATASQVVIIRELLAAFTGNELSIAITLAFWMLSVAAGCLIYKRIGKHPQSPATPAILFIIAGLAGLFQVVSVRLLHPAATIGEMLSPGMIVALSAIGAVPCAMTLGALFVALVGLAEGIGYRTPVSAVYGLEALGSATAGFLLSIYLLETLNSFGIMACVSIIGIICAAYLARLDKESSRPASVAMLLLTVGCCLVFGLSGRINLATRKLQWQPLEVRETVDSKYGSIVVTERDGTYDLFESGALSFTIPDPRYAEECAHVPLLHHPHPERVLIIGGAGSGIVQEVRKHPSVKRIDFVEIDPTMIALARGFSPPGWLDGTDKVPVRAIYGDGRRYVAGAAERYDVVILSVGLPTSLQIDRYYSVEFFRYVDDILCKNGIFSLKVPSSGAYVGSELASLVATLLNGCREVFEEVALLPGDYIHLLASQDLDLSGATPGLADELSARGIETAYINQYFIWDRFSPLRISHLDSLIARHNEGVIGSDMKPMSFSYAISLLAKHFKSAAWISGLASWLSFRSWVILLVAVGFGTVAIHLIANRAPLGYFPGSIAVYSMGLTTMFTEILLIMCFQIITGYVYNRIAGIVAAFMVGMGLASSLAGRRGWRPGLSAYLPFLHLGLVVLPVAVILAFNFIRQQSSSIPAYTSDLLFILMASLTGALGGVLFAVASSSLVSVRRRPAEAGAIAYSLDLAGASIAGFATGFLIIPSLGLSPAAYAISAFNLCTLVPVTLAKRAYS
jgi:spermidine synthase